MVVRNDIGNASHRHYSNNPHPYGLIRYPFGPELASRCNHVALQRPVSAYITDDMGRCGASRPR